jgi:hypothetical protein
MESLFCDQCHVYIQFHRICRWPHIEVGHLENDQVQARKFLGKGRPCILISHYFIQGQIKTNVYILLAPKAQYLTCSYKDCEGQYVANLLTGTFQH